MQFPVCLYSESYSQCFLLSWTHPLSSLQSPHFHWYFLSTNLENLSDVWAVCHIFSSVVGKVQVIPAACSPAKIASSHSWGRPCRTVTVMKGDPGAWRALLCPVKSLSSSNFINLYWSGVVFQCVMAGKQWGWALTRGFAVRDRAEERKEGPDFLWPEGQTKANCWVCSATLLPESPSQHSWLEHPHFDEYFTFRSAFSFQMTSFPENKQETYRACENMLYWTKDLRTKMVLLFLLVVRTLHH